MSAWSFWTGLAIWILIVGSLAIFLWFLAEVARLAREDTARRSARVDAARDDDGRDGGS